MRQGEFITSDTHFGHANIIKYCNRPFKNKDEMDRELIARWNAKVPEGAVVYHLGDFAFSREKRIIDIVRQLNGRIRFIRGNHDQQVTPKVEKMFEWSRHYYEANSDSARVKVVMFHFPIASWHHQGRGNWHLHGHCHNTYNNDGVMRFDVGVDAHPNYEPFSFEEIERIMKAKAIKIGPNRRKGF